MTNIMTNRTYHKTFNNKIAYAQRYTSAQNYEFECS